MDENHNHREKRIRKRLFIKKDTGSNKEETGKPRYPDIQKSYSTDSPAKPYRPNNPETSRPYTPRPNNFFRNGPDNKRPGEHRFGNQDKKFHKKPGFHKKRDQDSSLDELSGKFEFFKKYEGGKTLKPKNTAAPSKKEPESDLIRLNKYISNSGVCSRREADELITKGLIKVNGQVITELGHKIKHGDKVEFKGKSLNEANHVYILLNKPKDTITTTKDPGNRTTVMDLVQRATDQRVFPIGRLDRNTTGVLLLTNDGDFAQKLSHPSNEVKKVYLAILDKPLEREHFEQLVTGVELEDGPMNADEIAYVDPQQTNMIGLEIHSGKNRIVHRMFEHLGYKVKKLDRVVYAGLDKGGLRRGKFRFLRYDEVQQVLNTIKVHEK